MSELFKGLSETVSDAIPEYVKDNWFLNSHNILQLFEKQFPDVDYMDIITYPWQVREYFNENNKQNKNMNKNMNTSVEEITNILKNKR